MDNSFIQRVKGEAKLLLLDFDGTFYAFNKEFDDHCNDTAARVVMELGVPGDFEKVRQLCIESYENYSSSLIGFERTHGIKIQDWHGPYHSYLEDTHIREFHVTAQMLRGCKVPVAVLSHSSRAWLDRLMKKFQLDQVIPADRIFALEDVDYLFKHSGHDAYRRVLGQLGVAAPGAVMVEDSARNLKPAKELGMHTVWISHGRGLSEKDRPYVDLTVETLPEFLGMITP